MSELAEKVQRVLVEKGLVVEAGWLGFRSIAVPPDAGPEQIADMRGAFFAGAYHVWQVLNSVLDPGVEPTDDDARRMERIDDELRRFARDLQLRTTPARGSA